MTALDKSLNLDQVNPGLWSGRADPAYEANTGMFGGWTAALLLKAVIEHPQAEGSPSALTVNFIRRVAPGAVISVRAERIGGGRSIAHWRSTLTLEGESEPAAIATVVMTPRRDSDRFTEARMPEAPPPDQLPAFHPPGPFGEQMEIRYAIGANPFNQKTTRSLGWQRENSGRKIDAIGLAFLADLGWPRVFAISDGPRASSTITMSVYFHATPDELAAIGDDWLLCDMIGTRIEASTVGSKAGLWSSGGKLLATTEQLCWVR
jgi:acyl-CoA thioesterase